MTRPIVFLSDLGLRDEFVGACHAVIARIAPGTTVIDLSHGVPPQDVNLGALLLAEVLRYGPDDSILLGVVDPGVGTARKAIAVETAGTQILVGPDNGLLSLAWRALGGVRRAFEISSPEVLLTPVSAVFHGRDVFAPAAAHLAAGLSIDRLGPSADPAALVSLTLDEPEVGPGTLACNVLDVDRFGNLRLNARAAHLEGAGLDRVQTLSVESTAMAVQARRTTTYGEVGIGEYAVLIDAWGWVSVIRFEANASAGLDVDRGDPVWIRASPEGND
jgi:S-adenosylmethionine hydrolase